MELAFDLCTLALYDIAIYADDSTSMKFAEGAVSYFWASDVQSTRVHDLHYNHVHHDVMVMKYF